MINLANLKSRRPTVTALRQYFKIYSRNLKYSWRLLTTMPIIYEKKQTSCFLDFQKLVVVLEVEMITSMVLGLIKSTETSL